jgi:hypothetical protein
MQALCESQILGGIMCRNDMHYFFFIKANCLGQISYQYVIPSSPQTLLLENPQHPFSDFGLKSQQQAESGLGLNALSHD